MRELERESTVSEILLFFILSLFAWVIWVPQALHRFEMICWAPSLQSPLNALTVWAPGLAAMFLTYRKGKTGVASLFQPLTKWKVGFKWYLIVLIIEPGRWLLAFSIDRLMGGTYQLGNALLHDTFGSKAFFMIPVAVIFTIPNALGEELGWRAFALPRLQKRFGGLLASIIIGLFWGFWHIPAWIAWNTSDVSFVPIFLLVISTIPSAIIFTWLFNKTQGSLLVVVLYHASIANKGYFLPELPTRTGMVILWIIAFLIFITGGLLPPEDKSKSKSSQNTNPQTKT